MSSQLVRVLSVSEEESRRETPSLLASCFFTGFPMLRCRGDPEPTRSRGLVACDWRVWSACLALAPDFSPESECFVLHFGGELNFTWVGGGGHTV